MRLSGAVVLIAALVAGGCTAVPSWRSIDLGAVRPSALAAAGEHLLVTGSEDGAPAILRIDGSGGLQAFSLSPDGPEAAAADLVQVSVNGDRLQALGTMISGAHSNPRWTVWDGSLSTGAAASHAQEFFTFGGHDAGPLLGADWVADRPVILGSRTTSSGARAALYTSAGSTWSELAARPTPLSSTTTSQLGFSAVAGAGDQLVIAGDEVLLVQPLRQRPLIWVGSPDAGWTRLEPAASADSGAGLARAQAVACVAGAESCWVAGWVHGRLLAWSVTVGAQPSVSAPQLPEGSADVAAVPAGATDPVPRLAIWQGRPVIAGNGPSRTLWVGCPSGWRSVRLPDGTGSPVTAMAAVGGRLSVLIERTLWVTDHGPC